MLPAQGKNLFSNRDICHTGLSFPGRLPLLSIDEPDEAGIEGRAVPQGARCWCKAMAASYPFLPKVSKLTINECLRWSRAGPWLKQAC